MVKQKWLLEIWQDHPEIPFATAIEVEDEEWEEEENIEINATFVRRCVRIGKEIKKLRATAERLSVHVVIEAGVEHHVPHRNIFLYKAARLERSLPKDIYYDQD